LFHLPAVPVPPIRLPPRHEPPVGKRDGADDASTIESASTTSQPTLRLAASLRLAAVSPATLGHHEGSISR
jgi:hypothetical protein